MPTKTPTAEAAVHANLLTIPETGERLKVSRRAVYLLIDSGALRTVNIASKPGSKRMRIREDDLRAFIEKRTESGRPVESVA